MRPKPIYADAVMKQSNELSTTVDQWREALVASTKPKYPDGKTLMELSRELGINRSTLAGRLQKALEDGSCSCDYDVRNGRRTKVYRLEK